MTTQDVEPLSTFRKWVAILTCVAGIAGGIAWSSYASDGNWLPCLLDIPFFTVLILLLVDGVVFAGTLLSPLPGLS